jgi:hypothetical protein
VVGSGGLKYGLSKVSCPCFGHIVLLRFRNTAFQHHRGHYFNGHVLFSFTLVRDVMETKPANTAEAYCIGKQSRSNFRSASFFNSKDAPSRRKPGIGTDSFPETTRRRASSFTRPPNAPTPHHKEDLLSRTQLHAPSRTHQLLYKVNPLSRTQLQAAS